MLSLPNITLLAVATENVELSMRALIYSSKDIEFNCVKLISHYKPENCPDNIIWEEVHKMDTIDDWNHYMFYNLWKNVQTEFCIVVHADGFIVNPNSWKNEFLEYDYIGAPWDLLTARAIQGGRDQELVRVGNSVSLRSKRLLELPSKIGIPWIKYNNDYNEDTQICAHNRKQFIDNGIKFAPVEVAVHFSREAEVPEGVDVEPFAFHKYQNITHPNWKYPRL